MNGSYQSCIFPLRQYSGFCFQGMKVDVRSGGGEFWFSSTSDKRLQNL